MRFPTKYGNVGLGGSTHTPCYVYVSSTRPLVSLLCILRKRILDSPKTSQRRGREDGGVKHKRERATVSWANANTAQILSYPSRAQHENRDLRTSSPTHVSNYGVELRIGFLVRRPAFTGLRSLLTGKLLIARPSTCCRRRVQIIIPRCAGRKGSSFVRLFLHKKVFGHSPSA